MKFTIGFSPCPNDTFIFDALINNKIDTGSFIFEAVLADVETLNQWALDQKLDITKLSFPAFFKVSDHYQLLAAGSALGKGVGPLLISKTAKSLTVEEVNNSLIALPGKNTTANFLFSFAYPEARNKTFLTFHQIEDFVLNSADDDAKLGVIIHENRFTYRDKGLHKQADLGEVWESRMKVPIPLGGIAIRSIVEDNIARQVSQLIAESIKYAFDNYPALPSYVIDNSQELSEKVMRQHIELYVNNFSIDLGDEGRKAVQTLHEVFLKGRHDD